MPSKYRNLPIVLFLGLMSVPLVVMYAFLAVDTVSTAAPGTIVPESFSLSNWRFLWEDLPGKANIWLVTLNTFIFATATSAIVLVVSSAAGYGLSRLNLPFRAFFLAGVLVLHAFPTITLIVAIFLILQLVGLYNTLIGVILVKASLELPLGLRHEHARRNRRRRTVGGRHHACGRAVWSHDRYPDPPRLRQRLRNPSAL